jgi:ketosteroid isomerase-like protein
MVRKDADGVWKIARAIWNVAESRDPGDVADDG